MITERQNDFESAASETYIGEQAMIPCPDCGKVSAIANVEMIPHYLLPIQIPVGKCYDCGFTWSDHQAELVEEAYVRLQGGGK